MLHKALEQFLVDAYWGEPDFLLIDMPPGTGDVTLSLGQYLTKTEVYRGHHAPAGRPAGGPALGLRRPQAEAGRARGDREHELVHRRRRHPLRAVRGRRRTPAGRRARRAPAGPGTAGARPAGRGRRGGPGVVAEPDGEVAAVFDTPGRHHRRARARPASTGRAHRQAERSAESRGVSPTRPGAAGMPLRPSSSGSTPSTWWMASPAVLEAVGRARPCRAARCWPGPVPTRSTASSQWASRLATQWCRVRE